MLRISFQEDYNRYSNITDFYVFRCTLHLLAKLWSFQKPFDRVTSERCNHVLVQFYTPFSCSSTYQHCRAQDRMKKKGKKNQCHGG
ncbi:Uncharacterized protein TCM_002225 [Theobroma cacao]|uniref:Uncharacterized protein n=1 Tax=Theobroma cacao TaxID=3641 RepID=A0A061DKZ8_THECC|nr:Uncharacterized protein TCM_002225 [Theobroma cacao]